VDGRRQQLGGAGRWAFLEVTDPWNARSLIESRYLLAREAARR
jgi:hypothetical protein